MQPVTQFRLGIVMRRESESRVADKMRLQIWNLFLPHSDTLPDRKIAHQLVFPFVLKDIDRIPLGDNAFAVSEHMTSCDVPLPVVEGTVVACIEDNHLRIAVSFHYIIQTYVGQSEFQRISLRIGRHGGVGKILAGKFVFLLNGFFHEAFTLAFSLIISVCFSE